MKHLIALAFLLTACDQLGVDRTSAEAECYFPDPEMTVANYRQCPERFDHEKIAWSVCWAESQERLC